IYLLQRHGKPATASQLAEMSGQATANMGKHLKKLMDLDLIERTAIRNKQGRGHAYELTVRKNGKTQPLTKAIGKGARSRTEAPGPPALVHWPATRRRPWQACPGLDPRCSATTSGQRAVGWAKRALLRAITDVAVTCACPRVPRPATHAAVIDTRPASHTRLS